MEMLRRGDSRAIIRPSWPPPTQPTFREVGLIGREVMGGRLRSIATGLDLGGGWWVVALNSCFCVWW